MTEAERAALLAYLADACPEARAAAALRRGPLSLDGVRALISAAVARIEGEKRG